jgi:hypothetical protein
MNEHAGSFHTAFVTRDHVAEKNAWVRAARGRHRRFIGYRKWAEEAERVGRLEDYRRYSAEAKRQRAAAYEALSFARLEASYAT